jgi:DNA-binding winged helix-turn-helix (wHTH) protein
MNKNRFVKFNGWLFDSVIHTLTNESKPTVTLQAKQARCLNILIANFGSIVTRDDLIEEVWQGRYVDESTINSTLSRLRNIINCKGNVIKTHPKVGYSLICKLEFIDTLPPLSANRLISPLDTNTEDKNTTASSINLSFSARAITMMTFIFFIVCIVVYFLFISKLNKVQRVLADIEPLTYLVGTELLPSLSSDKKQLAFIHQSEIDSPLTLIVKNLETNVNTKIKSGQYVTSPYWSANNRTPYFQTYNNGQCMIENSQHLSEGKFSSSTHITSCGTELSMSPIAIDKNNEWLYFSYKASKIEPFIIKRFNLNSKKIEQLTSPSDTTYGDYSLSLSHNGKYIAFLRSSADTIKELNYLNLATKSVTPLTNLNNALYSITWNEDNSEIIYINDAKNLMSIDIKTAEINKLYSSNGYIKSPSTITNKAFIVSIGRHYKSNIKEWDIANPERPASLLISSSFSDHSAVTNYANNQKNVAFVSNRSGKNQIWLYDNYEYQQLSKFSKQHTLSDLNFSENGKHLVFIKDHQLQLLNLSNRTITSPLKDIKNIRNLSWSCGSSDELYASVRRNDMWNLLKLNINTNVSEKLMPAIHSIKKDCVNNQYYVTKVYEQGIFKVNPDFGSSNKVIGLNELHFIDAEEWEVRDNKIYYLQKGNLNIINLLNGDKQKYTLDSSLVSQFKLINGKVIFTYKSLNDSHLAKISFK